MQTKIPAVSIVFRNLLQADILTQWRNRRSVIMVLLVPVIILISWKGLVPKFGGPFVLSNCITVGLTAIGLMGYSNAVARDRDRGIFQRLRVAPVPAWSIMASRLFVQLLMIMMVAIGVFIAGKYFDEISLAKEGYMLAFISAIVGGFVYLGLGQLIVGLIKNAETVSSTTRLVYFIFIMVGMFGELGVLGKQIGDIVRWSPYGTVKHIISDSLQPARWSRQTTMALIATLAYGFTFSILGISWFRWNPK